MIGKRILEEIGGRGFGGMRGRKELREMGKGLGMRVGRKKRSGKGVEMMYEGGGEV